ncbi:MAG: D-2-hydroxyacid dehydrogenase, partial [Bryobacteraceae bacterium]|nr:D-2-hydroxyacid dehydrogenase [Bryobacteraceae bacterium]
MNTKIVVLDGQALSAGDLTWDSLQALGDVQIFERTAEADVVSRAAGASVILTNKTPLRASTIEALPDLKFIAVLATGYDIIDLKAAGARGIPVSNVPTYGTNSVAQFAFALLLELCHRVQRHSDDVQVGGWVDRKVWSYHLTPLIELHGKTMGLIGYGRIGRQTAEIAKAFGMTVIASDPGH